MRLGTLGLAACVVLSAVPAQAQRSTADGVFTAAQAKAGEEAYQSHCAGCHGLDLKKTDAEAPDLTDGPYRFGWNGKTVGERFDAIRKTMPRPPLPRLTDQMYIDIVAYILSFNGSPAGNEPLPADMAKLGAITIEVSQTSGGGGRRR